MKKAIVLSLLVLTSSMLAACKTVWLNDITLADDGTYIVASYTNEGNGELYRAKVEGNKLKMKLIVGESKYSR